MSWAMGDDVSCLADGISSSSVGEEDLNRSGASQKKQPYSRGASSIRTRWMPDGKADGSIAMVPWSLKMGSGRVSSLMVRVDGGWRWPLLPLSLLLLSSSSPPLLLTTGCA